MANPSYLIQPNIQRLPSLIQDIQTGEIRVPRFQRPFVWKIQQCLDLFKSIYDGIPIGSILLWRTRDHTLRCYESLASIPLGWTRRSIADDERQVRQYVLDGHQRLTTLFAALGAGLMSGETVAEPTTAQEIDDGPEDGSWPIYFDLEEKTFRSHRRRGKPPETWLPLSILLDPYKLFEFQKRLLDREADRTLVNRAEALASTFKDYSIPVVPIVTDSLDLATESFQRVNSAGTRMSEVHMVSALTWTPEFDLNERIREARTSLGEVGWEELEDQVILDTCKAVLDLDIYYAKVQSVRESINESPQVLDDATAALKLAARFLRDRCKVYGPAVLPYSSQIILLADTLRLASRDRDQSPDLEADLERWFWLTTYTEHFTGISAAGLARTLEHLRGLVTGDGDPTPPGLIPTVKAPRRFSFKTARSKAMAFRMADQQRKVIPSAPDPYQILADHGSAALSMLITGREIEKEARDSVENRILVDPRETLAMRRQLLSPELGSAEILSGYAITELAVAILSKGNVATFLVARRMELLGIEKAFVQELGLSYDAG